MKNTILFFFLLLAAAVSAQSNSFVTDRLRAAEYFRIGTNTSQKVTGFDRVITAPGTHDSLPTSRAVVDFLEANFTPIGYYTAGTGISISDDVITNAAPDQVVGLTGGGISVITGTYPNFTITSNEVDGSTTNELQNLSLSGQSLSISSGTGVTLPVVGVSAGTGIGVSGSGGTFTVSNTGDLSATNEIQTLSIDGSDLTLSLGGGTVTLPGGADGNGIYGGSGTVPDNTRAEIGDNGIDFKTSLGDFGNFIGFSRDETNYFGAGADGAADGEYKIEIKTQANNDNTFYTITPYRINMSVGDAIGPNLTQLGIDRNGVYVASGVAEFGGMQYTAEYPDILTNDRSIPDVGLTKQLISSENGALGTGFTGGGGSGMVPGGTTVQVQTDGDFTLDLSAPMQDGYICNIGDVANSVYLTLTGTAFGLVAGDAGVDMYSDGGNGEFNLHSAAGSIVLTGSYGTISISNNPDVQFFVNDQRASPKGLEYTDDYSETLKTNDRSLTDVGTVNLLKQTPVSYTNAAAPNNTIFYSTTDSKLSYKDPGGTVHGLY